MCSCTRLLLLATLPALVGRAGWGADGEVVSVTEAGAGSGGAGPAFAPRQHTDLVAAVGQAATLECRMLRLRDKSVSWVRSRDLQILSHAGVVFTADARVSATSGGGRHAHTLRIERLRVADSGRYECQVNTEPKMSLFFNLTVLDEPVPVVVVEAEGATRVAAPPGGSATLACEAHYEPQPRALPVAALDIHWFRGGIPIDVHSASGGVALDTERWGWRALSRLTLAGLTPLDDGAYTCAAGDANATLWLHVTDEAQEGPMEAMQRDETATRATGGGCVAPWPRWPLVLLLLTRCLFGT